ncbi:TetR family transcriptional regulator [Scopulibacillus darangshiensis]|uniref:TetR family transcriptional regulator n=1 Tax=Scopulibacillus darangshiensis TaxID=442528 RepID=A0A4R2NHR2_9BACL|nr:TetR/AcrR family transcriptional regulator [Scopulibacillus darangshiensis]TCP20782.1 TetR family transcriptional regulator [Scopulibacillus darangshiensis]
MTKDKLIRAAINNFSKYGYQGATMSNIAKDAGIKPASIYYFFENKEELIREAVQAILNHHFASMKETFYEKERENVNVLFSELFGKIVLHHTENEDETKAYVIMVNSPISNIKKQISDYLHTYNNWLVEQLTSSIRRHHPDLEEATISEMIDYFIFIGNGLFWGVVIHDKAGIQRNLTQASHLMAQYVTQILGSGQNEKQQGH